eukprot:6124392-Amphidinium_carterae.2
MAWVSEALSEEAGFKEHSAQLKSVRSLPTGRLKRGRRPRKGGTRAWRSGPHDGGSALGARRFGRSPGFSRTS